MKTESSLSCKSIMTCGFILSTLNQKFGHFKLPINIKVITSYKQWKLASNLELSVVEMQWPDWHAAWSPYICQCSYLSSSPRKSPSGFLSFQCTSKIIVWCVLNRFEIWIWKHGAQIWRNTYLDTFCGHAGHDLLHHLCLCRFPDLV